MASKIPPPAPMDVKGDLKANWRFFKSQWDNYEIATEIKGKDENIRVATLLTVMGKECFQTFQHLSMSDADRKRVDAVLDALKKHFEPKTNVIYERYMFNTTDQEQTESVDRYVTRLRRAAESCEFGELLDQMIRDRLVLGTNDNAARSRMLREPTLTLERAIDTCRTSEMTNQQMKKLTPATEAPQVNFATKQAKGAKSKLNKVPKQKNKPDQRDAKISACKYCGGSHARDRKLCPAHGKTCHKCKKKNHFESMCLSYRPMKSVHAIEETDSSDSDESLFSVQSEKHGKQWFVNVNMSTHDGNAQQVKCQMDTGSTVNVIGHKELCKIMRDGSPRLQPSRVALKLYDGSRMSPEGKINIKCQIGKRSRVLEFQVVIVDQIALLCPEACEDMNLLTVNRINSLSTNEKPITVKDILCDYSDVFEGLGSLCGEYHIELDESVKPVQHQPRKVPEALKSDLQREISCLEKRGVIKKVTTPTDWISSMVAVKKSSGKLRICIDPKDLNNAIKRPHYPMSSVEDILPKLSNAKVFTVLDAKDGYWHIKLDEESSYLTTFWTPFGRYRWLRMPFGIKSAPEEFQRRQHEALEGLPGVQVIVDDILVYGSGDNMDIANLDHDRNLKQVLKRAREVGMRLNKDKLNLRKTEVSYMGHMLTSKGLKPDPDKVSAILDMPEPTDVKSTQRFVGFVTYLSKFMPHLSELCEPLRRLTTKDAVFTWQSEQQNAFDTIKRLVTQQPILKYYDLSSEVTIQCDASQVGLGASLLQNNQPVTFASRALTDTEQRYAQIEKECLAIVFACERFDQYLLGRDVITVHSDHKPLETVFKKPLMTAPKRLQRMLLKLQKYSLRVEYKKGTQMYIADMLSRASLPLHVNTQLETKSEQIFRLSLENVNLTDGIKVSRPRIQQIKKHTQQDETLQTLKSVILMGWPETREAVPIVIREYWSYRDELTVQDGLLFKGELIIIPKTMRPEMLSKIHSSHLGIESCLRKARDTLYWPHMSSEIRDFVSQCSVCNEYEQRQQKEPLMTHQIPEYPWSKLGVDIFTLHKEDYLITVDYYSDFWELDKLADTTSSTVIECLKQHFARHGIPDEVVTDNGPQLSSAEFESFARDWEFDHITTSPYHSQSNGKAESAVKIAKKLLKKSKKGGKDQWKSVLDWRNTPTEGMDSSPVQRLMSRRTQHSLPMAKALLRPQTVKEVPEKIKRKRQKAKQYYDVSAKTLPELNIGQNICMAPLPTDREKRWKFGKCVDQISPRSYIVDVNGRIYQRNRKYLRTTPELFEIPTDVFDQHPGDLPERASENNVTADRETINKGNSGQNGNGNNNKMSGAENTNCDNRANPSQTFIPGTPKRTRTRDVKRPKKFDDFVLIQ